MAEYDENTENIISATEIYITDYSKTDKKQTDEELKDGFKTRFCDVRKK